MKKSSANATHPSIPSARGRVRAFVFAAVVVAVDQATKMVALTRLDPEHPVDLVGSFVRLKLQWNSGAAFSLGEALTPYLTVLALLAGVVTVTYVVRTTSTAHIALAGLALGGIAGNLLDRLLRQPGPFTGHVIDFIAIGRYPVFNIADSALCIAAALYVFRSVRTPQQPA